jgi:PKD domain-containing protein
MLHRLLLNLTLAATALALMALASPWATNASADAAQVTVVSPGGTQQTLSLEALAGGEDVVDRAFVLRSGSGEGTHAVSGFSLAKVLEAAGADPYSFSYVEVQRPAGGAVRLSRHQALDPSAFAEGPPTIYPAAGGTGFLRPSAGPEDANAADSFLAPQGITLTLRKGVPISVTAKATPLKAKPGQPVSFEAVVEGAGAGEKISYSWFFDDGGAADTASATHSFAKRGSYDVVVGVTTPGNPTGSSDVITIQVGSPIAGPDRKGGGTNKDAEAPDHGSADGPLTGTESGGSVPPTSAPPASVAAPSTPAPAPATPPAAQKDPAPQVPTGERVVGELVSATTDVPPSRPTQAAARSGQLQGDNGGGGGIPDAAWGLLAAVGLFGAGALLEARNLFG